MRKVLLTAAALLLCAAPVRAQQALATTTDAAPAAQADQPKAERTPSLYPTSDEVRRQVSKAEAARHDTAPLGSRDWWYLVAAIAVGVIIAAVLL
ncbi:MAG TPA: hypothetical protein VF771_03350 [Longimicrobiaceae bacterium]